MSDLVVLQRLLLIAVLAGCIGYERERHGRAAGLRTHLLVGIGSCLVMLTALYLMETLADRVEADPGRFAAQVISGIGFLGAGTIIRFRASIRGLTTAASIWAVAGIGLAAGCGFLFGAVATTAIVLIALYGFGQVERRMRKDCYKTLVTETNPSGEMLTQIRRVLSDHNVEIRDLEIKRTEQPNLSVVELSVRILSERDAEGILGDVAKLEGIQRARWVT